MSAESIRSNKLVKAKWGGGSGLTVIYSVAAPVKTPLMGGGTPTVSFGKLGRACPKHVRPTFIVFYGMAPPLGAADWTDERL